MGLQWSLGDPSRGRALGIDRNWGKKGIKDLKSKGSLKSQRKKSSWRDNSRAVVGVTSLTRQAGVCLELVVSEESRFDGFGEKGFR